jgi:hypothetical protein
MQARAGLRGAFGELKLDIFRLRNYHEYEGQQEKFERITREFATAAGAGAILPSAAIKAGAPAVYVLVAASPLKSNNSVRGLTPGDKTHTHATLKRLPNGKYAYNDFADWWLASVEKFKALSAIIPITSPSQTSWIGPFLMTVANSCPRKEPTKTELTSLVTTRRSSPSPTVSTLRSAPRAQGYWGRKHSRFA